MEYDLQKLTEYIQRGTNNFHAYNLRGSARAEQHDYAGAIEDFTQALVYNPNHAETYNNRAYVFLALKEYTEALKDFSTAISTNYADAYAYNGRGIVWADMGNYNKALSDFSKAIEIYQDYTEAYNNRAYAFYKKKEYDNALADFTQAIQTHSHDAYAYNGRGLVKAAIGNFIGAIKDYDKALEIQALYSEASLNKILAKKEIGDAFVEDTIIGITTATAYSESVADYTTSIATKILTTEDAPSEVFESSSDTEQVLTAIAADAIAVADTDDTMMVDVQPNTFEQTESNTDVLEESLAIEEAAPQSVVETMEVDTSKPIEPADIILPEFVEKDPVIVMRNDTIMEEETPIHTNEIIEDITATTAEPIGQQLQSTAAMNMETIESTQQALFPVRQEDTNQELAQEINDTITPSPITTALQPQESKTDEPQNIIGFDTRIPLELELDNEAALQLAKGNKKLAEEKYQAAIAAYKNVLTRYPDSAVTHNCIGVWHNTLAQYDEAIESFNRAIVIYPQYVYAYNNRAVSEIAKKQYHQALEDYNYAIAIDSNYADSYYGKAWTESILSRHNTAIINYGKAIAIYRKAIAYQYEQANLNLAQGKADVALNYFDQCIATYTKYAQSVYGQRDAGESIGRSIAIISTTNDLTIDQLMADVYANRATIKKKQGFFKAAKLDYQKADRIKKNILWIKNGLI